MALIRLMLFLSTLALLNVAYNPSMLWEELGVTHGGRDFRVPPSQLPWLRNVSRALEAQTVHGRAQRRAWRSAIAQQLVRAMPAGVRGAHPGATLEHATTFATSLTYANDATRERLLVDWVRGVASGASYSQLVESSRAEGEVRRLLRLRSEQLTRRLRNYPPPSSDVVAAAAEDDSMANSLPTVRRLAESVRPLLADMFCAGCAESNGHAQRRALSGGILIGQPAAALAALMADFARWAEAAWARAAYSAAVTLTPEDMHSEAIRNAPAQFVLHHVSHNVSLGRLATGNAASTLQDAAGNEYVQVTDAAEASLEADASLFSDIVIGVTLATAGGLGAALLGQPALLGYLLSGIAAGPNVGSLIHEVIQTEALGQLGVALILFALGVELDLSRLAHVRNVALVGGLLQQLGTASLTATIGVLGGLDAKASLFLGLCSPMASTTVVLRCLQARGAVNSAEGTTMLAILVTQDLSVGVFLGLLPVLRHADHLSRALVHAAGAGAVLALALLALRSILGPLAAVLAKVSVPELETLVALAVLLAVASATESFGISIELGAFVAGLTWSATLPTHAHRAVQRLEPIRDAFGALFFFSVGMVINPTFFLAHYRTVVCLAIAVFGLKLAVAAPLIRVFGYEWGMSLRCGAGLSHLGEFAFLIASRGRAIGLLDKEMYMLLLGVTAISLFTSPLAVFVLADEDDCEERRSLTVSSCHSRDIELGTAPRSAKGGSASKGSCLSVRRLGHFARGPDSPTSSTANSSCSSSPRKAEPRMS